MSGPESMPPAPEVSFASDNTAGVAPAVMEALAAANTASALAYDADAWSQALTARFADLLGRPIEVLTCWGGTGANVVGLASVLESWQAVICAESAHLVTDECGAPARFTGALLVTEPCEDGKLTPAAVDRRIEWLGNQHHPQPGVVSISQVTELGAVYSPGEIAAIAERAHAAGMYLHVDGARIANALAATGTDLAAMVADTGVDVMTWGATKNGAMYGEAVLYLRPELATNARFVRKQAGQLPSKTRFVAAQMLALLDDDLWLSHAAHANAMATLLAERVRGIDGVEVIDEPQANAVFVRLPHECIAPLQEWSFFWGWDEAAGMVRWMTHFATTPDDVDRFAAGVEAVLAAR
ncbi:MAG: aminotransferase class V-fold PLP-dependent enzyme [Acidimicrobiales bacterium]|nr:aminotransferase class V-fold PLP-dependent enzyme [Acidimicrobiales bacterium]